MSPLLEARGLCAAYGATQVVFDLDLRVGAGRVSALLGANGAGKTTTLRAISRLVRSWGTLALDGQPLAGSSTEQVARLGVAHVPDGRGTFGALSVAENLKLGAHTRRDRAAAADDLARVYARFPRLAERRRQLAGSLSGGEQQMLAIGRALMQKPRLLLLDEPSFGLAPKVVAEIFELLARIHRDDGVALLLVEQNAHAALDLADDAVVLEAGRAVLAGPAATVRADAAVRRAYLGA